MEKNSETLIAVLRIISDESLKILISLALQETRRRNGVALAKCKARTNEGLPNIIFKDLGQKKNT
jgi:hypothetical protein